MTATYETGKAIDIIRDSTQQVFSLMLGLPLEAEEAYFENAQAESFDGLVSVIGLAGSCVGSGRISCSAAFACRVAGALLSTAYEVVDEDVLDAMAELTNMIIGNLKSALEDDLGPVGLSIPTVIFGRNYRARSTGVNEWLVVPFRSDGERMHIRFCLVPGRAPVRSRMETSIQTAV
jgi:chemotaxis protein CheX